uniref:SET domain-containing protein n=1 Tax=Lotharella globosa TaxID=91324 RepID=A0A7S4DSI2_9EUKA|mmetsp:Transcript_0/g.2  ORF Transcript_0/g.2 Transcript_0/m.2 type:complete len:107 (+) Transcript_0:72-392(+)
MLVPILDVANHAPSEAGGGFFEVTSDSVSLVVGSRGANKGEEVYLDYGERPVEDFLLHYGFVPERCPSDSISVPIVASEDDGRERMVHVSWKQCRSSEGHPDPKVN